MPLFAKCDYILPAGPSASGVPSSAALAEGCSSSPLATFALASCGSDCRRSSASDASRLICKRREKTQAYSGTASHTLPLTIGQQITCSFAPNQTRGLGTNGCIDGAGLLEIRAADNPASATRCLLQGIGTSHEKAMIHKLSAIIIIFSAVKVLRG